MAFKDNGQGKFTETVGKRFTTNQSSTEKPDADITNGQAETNDNAWEKPGQHTPAQITSHSGTGRQIVREARHTYTERNFKKQENRNQKDENIKTDFQGYGQEFQKPEEKFFDENEYVRFRVDKDSPQYKGKEIDKIALKSMKTDKGGGAVFTSDYNEKGKLETKTELFKDKDRVDKGNGAIHFIDRMERKKEYFADSENQAATSNVDEKAEIFMEHQADRILEKKQRYHDIHKDVKKERKQLEKTIKEERKQEKRNQKFKDPTEKFSNSKADTSNFLNVLDSKFRGEGTKADGSTLFAVGTTASVTVDNIVKGDVSKQKKRKNKKQNSPSDTNKEKPTETSKKGHVGTQKNEIEMSQQAAEKNFSLMETGNSENAVSSASASGLSVAGSENKTQQRFMTNEERLEQAKSKEKSVKKSESKEVRKAAAVTSVAKMLDAKKNMQNQLGDMSGQGSGDLMKDGMSGLMQSISGSVKNAAMHVAKSAAGLLLHFAAAAMPILLPVLAVVLVIVIITGAVGGVVGILSGGDAGETYDLDVTSDGYVYLSLSDSEIDEIIKSLNKAYEITETQETILRYALSKVGCAYDQDYHGSMTADIFDCSSLAYRAYSAAGIDISNNGNYTAAEECYRMDVLELCYEGEMQPGDLIFYGNSDNGRYLGTYHVAIYVGKVNGADKMVEARGTSWGVVYCDVRATNVVRVARAW